MQTRPRQIVLDFDGVIADGTNRAYLDAYVAAVRAVGGGMTEAQIEAAILRRWGESPRRELGGVLGDAHPALDAALQHYLARIDDRLVHRAQPLPGALETAAQLAKSYPLYLISGMGQAPLNRLVEAFHLGSFFRQVISTSDSNLPQRQKASGYHLRRLCRQQGLEPGETLCVGDAASDVAMARSCGVPIALVLSGVLNRTEAEALKVTWILDDLAALPEFLRQQAAGTGGLAPLAGV